MPGGKGLRIMACFCEKERSPFKKRFCPTLRESFSFGPSVGRISLKIQKLKFKPQNDKNKSQPKADPPLAEKFKNISFYIFNYILIFDI